MPTVLIIEDDANTRMFTAINLSTRGYNVIEASDGKDGEEKLLKHRPDVLLLDIRLPEKTGLEILDTMSRDQHLRGIPVIIMTASHLNLIDDDWENRPLVREVLVKPFKANRLVEAVSSALTRN